MENRRRYRKKAEQFVVAIQLAIDTQGFRYTKWGGKQRCKKDDWIVDNNGDIYTVDNKTFNNTYRRVSPGIYIKTSTIWAEQAKGEGSVVTKEGTSEYKAGDYLVSNNEDGTDAYCITTEKFEAMYELDE